MCIRDSLGVDPAHIRVVVPLKKNYEEMKRIIREEIESVSYTHLQHAL